MKRPRLEHPRQAAIATALALSCLLGGCRTQRSERELLIEAASLAQAGDVAAAFAIVDRVHAANPGSPEVIIRYTAMLIDTGDLDRAQRMLDQLDGMDLRGTERARANAEKRRLLETVYEQARGPGPHAPSDPVAYERAVIGLINLERTGIILDEYNQYLLMQARAELGAPPERSIDLHAPQNVAAAATPTQARTALVYLERLLDGDERCEARRELEGAALLEAQAIREALNLKVFGDDFDRAWEVRHREAFEAAGRFDPVGARFVVRHHGPYRDGLDAAAPPERLRYVAQTWFAREAATALVYELADQQRSDAAPLPYAVGDFSTTQVTDLIAAESLSFTLLIPYDTVRRGAFLLHRSMQHARDPEPSVTDRRDADAHGADDADTARTGD